MLNYTILFTNYPHNPEENQNYELSKGTELIINVRDFNIPNKRNRLANVRN